MSEVRDSVLVEVMEALYDHDRGLHAKLMDDVARTLTPAQRYYVEHYRSYICRACGEVMITDLEGRKVDGAK